MPLNSIPATTTLDALRVKAETARDKCAIDYGFWGGVVPGNEGELQKMVEAGALGFKCFLCESGVDEFPMSREADLRIAMPILAKAGVPLLVHAEIDDGHTGAPHSRSYDDYLKSRPPGWEVEAIRMMIRLARETGCRTHIVHLSAADALEEIRAAKAEGVPITVETCPHYLHFESERILEGATHYKCAPPIREHANRERLWRGLKDGTIDFVVSDHSPCVPALKLPGEGDFMKAWGGIAGLQFSLPVVWTEMRKRGMDLLDLSRLMSSRTAAFAGLSRRKGLLQAGYDADLLIWKPEAEFEVKRDQVLHRHDVTPYLGARLSGVVTKTLVRGKPAGQHVGQQVKRQPA
jgi:allantoinase